MGALLSRLLLATLALHNRALYFSYVRSKLSDCNGRNLGGIRPHIGNEPRVSIRPQFNSLIEPLGYGHGLAHREAQLP